MKVSGLFLLAQALPAAYAVGSSTWYFPGGDIIHHFIVNPLTFPQSGWTLETWVYPLENTNGKWWLSFATTNSGSWTNCFVQPATSFTVDTWQHVLMTWDGSTNRIYFDGVEKEIGRHPATASCLASEGSLTIGQEQDSVGGSFDANQSPNMYLDSVAVYSRAWDADEVAQKAANTCVDMSDPDIFAAWFTADGSDSTGQGHDASVVPDHSGNGVGGGITSSVTTEGIYGYCARGACFNGNGTVVLKSGESKRFSDLHVGEVIKTSDGEGTFSFNSVLSLPHAKNTEPATFLSLTTETGKEVEMTTDHFIPTCEGKEETAGELVVGDCVLTVDGKENLMKITSSRKTGVYTATTQDKYIVVDGVVASPYSKEFLRPSPDVTSFDWAFKTLKQKQQQAVSLFKKRLRGSTSV